MTAATLWVLGRLTWKYRGLTLNTTARADGGQLHYCVNTSPFGLTLSHHRVTAAARLTPGWLPFSSCRRPSTLTWFTIGMNPRAVRASPACGG